MHRPRRPLYASPYIGLDALYASGKVNASKVNPITIRPRISAQVFVNEPGKLAPIGERDYWHETYGMMSTHERRLHVTSEIHTVVQFRAIDFGMEDCHLVFTLPPLGVPLEKGASIEFNPSSRFDVFRLESERPVDLHKLSYKTRPKVLEKVAVGVNPRADEETLIHRFPCPRASLHVFEVACADGSDCMIDTWSSHNTSYGKLRFFSRLGIKRSSRPAAKVSMSFNTKPSKVPDAFSLDRFTTRSLHNVYLGDQEHIPLQQEIQVIHRRHQEAWQTIVEVMVSKAALS
ncbi:hypothetical protein NUW54_g13930 [Trametes sanguinea]|uniref:Uncharacterized protein n=1 Tax=Trametes sanguinea TaxID=158606 RepID=A0ACC1MGN7_9APHY|nr:hypothetical protein NUW54_g13930 [Trametes sanguinea]